MKRLLAILPSSGFRFPALDGLRGLAAVAVCLGHVPLVTRTSLGTYGSAAVTVFFCLSAFLLFYPYCVGRQSAPPAYLWRRLWRIYPAWLIALLVGVLAAAATGQAASATDVLTHLFFVHTFSAETARTVILPAWSMPAEVQFYLLLPLVAPLLLGSRRLAVAAGLAVAAYLALQPLSGGIAGLNWPYLALPFILGMAAAWLVGRRAAVPTWLAPLGLLGLLVFGSLVSPFPCGPRSTVVSAFAFAAVLGVAANGSRLLGWAPLRLLGICGYGLFLLHWPLITVIQQRLGSMAALLLGLPAAIAAAMLCYTLIEEPCIRFSRRAGRRVSDQPLENRATLAPAPPFP